MIQQDEHDKCCNTGCPTIMRVTWLNLSPTIGEKIERKREGERLIWRKKGDTGGCYSQKEKYMNYVRDMSFPDCTDAPLPSPGFTDTLAVQVSVVLNGRIMLVKPFISM